MRLAKHPAECELEKIDLCRRKVDALRNEIKHIEDTKADLKSVTYDHAKDRNHNYNSPVEDAILSAETQKERISKNITKHLETRERLINNVLGLSDSNYVALLSLLFIECKTPLQIIDKMGYAESWFWKHRRKALQEYSNTYMLSEDPARVATDQTPQDG